MSQPPYSYGPTNDPGQQQPVDPYQPSAAPTYPDPTYQDPNQQPAGGYPPAAGVPAGQPYPSQPFSGAPVQSQPYSAQPYSPGPSYAGQQPGYADPAQAGYPGQQPGYADPAQGGYPGQQPGYADPAQGGYPGQQPGYADPAQGGYPGQQPGYADPAQGGYPGQQPGYADPAQGGYLGQQPGYPGAPQGYPGAQPSYPGQQPGYPGAPQGYPGYPGYPAQPPKSNRTGLIVGIVAALVVVVVGGGIGAAFAFSHGHGGTSKAGGATHSGDLRDYLVTMPSAAQKCEDEEGTNEVLSLDQAAQLSDNADARKSELQKFGFKTGAARCWVNSDDSSVDIRLYQFGSSTDAKGFFDEDIDGTSSAYDAANKADVAGVPDAKSFATPDKDDQGFVQALEIGLNGDVVMVVVTNQHAPLSLDSANDLLKQEYQKL
ncbi:hypothetical protein GCM10023322_70530 [Rugosimonospora acidiphila]|uniref:DUF4367 domain-containing protein n=1 Tax=Rugosimonospora acidiphila TaxID=556531 RepID=A0ABP9SLD7_9ACTN